MRKLHETEKKQSNIDAEHEKVTMRKTERGRGLPSWRRRRRRWRSERGLGRRPPGLPITLETLTGGQLINVLHPPRFHPTSLERKRAEGDL